MGTDMTTSVERMKAYNSKQENVVVGLCVGDDSLFVKYSNVQVTTLTTKVYNS